jgi:hypothetical protein
MNVLDFTPEQRFALSLSSPILATGAPHNFEKVKFTSELDATEMLSSWWGVRTKDELEEILTWLDDEMGHTKPYIDYFNVLEEKLNHEKLSFIDGQEDQNEKIRFQLIYDNLYTFNPHSVRAFDFARYLHLLRSGYVLGWYEEDEFWQRSIEQSKKLLEFGLFDNHFDFLYGYYTGRVFGMKLADEGVKDSLRIARILMSSPESPFLTWAPWPVKTPIEQHVGVVS